MQINHHGRPTTLDLDCRETLRCPLLSFYHLPRQTPSASTTTAQPSSTEQGIRDGLGFDPSARPSTGETARDETSESCRHSCDKGEGFGKHGTLRSLSGIDNTKVVEMGQAEGEKEANNVKQDCEGCRGGFPANRAASSYRGTCQDGNSAMKTTPDQADPHTHDANPSHLTHGVVGRDSSSRAQHRLLSPPHYALVPARLVAVLVDGAGRGWMATRRLWSVREVGVHALVEAGLALADVDQEQEVRDKGTHDCCDRSW